jgi:AAA15 family ATPase/GTPase
VKLGEITLLQVENLGKIKFASLQLDAKGELIKICGPNDSGKSTLIDSLRIAFESAKTLPPDIIRHGSARATIQIETSEGYSINRVIKKDDNGEQNTVLEVKFRGAPVAGGAVTFLKQLSAAYMDPQVIADYTDTEMLKVLAKYAGVDLDSSEKMIQEYRNNTTDIKRSIKSLGTKTPPVSSSGGQVVDLKTATDNYDKISKEYNESISKYTQAQSRIREINNLITTTETEIREYQLKIDRLNATLVTAKESQAAGTKWLEEHSLPDKALLDKAKAQMDEAVQQQSMGEEVRAYELWFSSKTALETELATAEAKVKDAEDARKKSLELATFPEENMRIADGKVLLGDGLWVNGSTSAKILAAAKICSASIPEGGARILYIHRGESLGRDRQIDLARFAKEHNVQILMEVMSDSPKEMTDAIIIEDGEVTIRSDKSPISEVFEEMRAKKSDNPTFQEIAEKIEIKPTPEPNLIEDAPWAIKAVEPEQPARDFELDIF